MIDPDRLLGLEFPGSPARLHPARHDSLCAWASGSAAIRSIRSNCASSTSRIWSALPTMAVTLAYPGYWYRDLDTGLDHQRTVHASENVTIHATLPVEGEVVARPRVIGVIDKGRERGALVVSERDIRDTATGNVLATMRQTAMCRGDGGFSRAPRERASAQRRLPDRAPDRALTLPTSPQAALIYRLSGDPDPLHVDPEFAHAAGFPRPVLHGLATMGLICHAAVREALDGAPERLRTMDCRFTVPVYPGDAIALRLLAYGNGLDVSRLGRRPARRLGGPRCDLDQLIRGLVFLSTTYPTIGHLGSRAMKSTMTMQFDKLNVLSAYQIVSRELEALDRFGGAESRRPAPYRGRACASSSASTARPCGKASDNSKTRVSSAAKDASGLTVSVPGSGRISSQATRAMVMRQVTFRELWEVALVLEPACAALCARNRRTSRSGRA